MTTLTPSQNHLKREDYVNPGKASRISLARQFHMLNALVRREILKSFHKSMLGILWHIVIPLIHLIIFFHIYSALSQNHDVFATAAGLAIWLIFNNSMMPAVNATMASKNLVSFMDVPIYLFPASAVVMSLLFFLLFIVAVILFGLVTSAYPPSGALVGAFIIFLFSLFTFGIALLISLGNVFFRDIGMLWNSLSFLLFITAPVLYPVSVLSGGWENLIVLNPITHFIEALRICMMSNFWSALLHVDWMLLLIITCIPLLVGIIFYRSTKQSTLVNL